MRMIPLTQGQYAIVDDANYEALNKHKWCAAKMHGKYYAIRGVRNDSKTRTVYLHREILQPAVGQEIDHINGNPLDNRDNNLRLCTSAQNHMNQRPRGGSSQFKGVTWHKRNKKWQAEIQHNGKSYWLSAFADETDAARAYDKAAREHFGEFARLNFPERERQMA